MEDAYWKFMRQLYRPMNLIHSILCHMIESDGESNVKEHHCVLRQTPSIYPCCYCRVVIECPRKFWLIPGRHQTLTYNA